MHRSHVYCFAVSLLLATAVALGCSKTSAPEQESVATTAKNAQGQSDEIAAAFASLSPEDRRAAMAQKYCAVEQENLLGSMGTPIKVMVDGEAVFLCCEGCQEKALKDPKATLAAVAKLKSSAAAAQ
jgi:hypothetical protein